jgi:3-hydroxymyristoyl/3-hydroxydecanoyl-(acyl carrier protein) dehydratase
MQVLELDTRPISLPDVNENFPRVLTATVDRPNVCFGLDVSQDLSWFRGHFPDMPILPGVVQLHWAVIVARAVFKFPDSPLEVKRLKFKNVVIPPRVLELSVSVHASNEVQFEFYSPDEQYSLGRLVFAASTTC